MKSRSFVIALASFFLVACSTPSDHVGEGATAEFSSSKEPLKAAACIARNGDEFFQGYSGQVRDSDGAGKPVEVVIRAGENVFAVVQILPNQSGSSIKVFFRAWTASIFPKKDGLTVEQRLVKGCI